MRILLLSWHYRDGSSEGLCAQRVAEALQDCGHQVVVVTHGQSRARGHEVSTAAPEIVTVAEAEAARPWWRYWNRTERRTPVHRVISAALNLRHFANAQQWAWVEAAADAVDALVARQAQLEQPFDVLFSRLNPQMSHQAAQLVLRRQSKRGPGGGLPWCAYFSDPWPHSLYPVPFNYTAGPLSRRRGLGVVHSIFGQASALVFPSRRLADYMLNPAIVGTGRVLERAAKRCFVVPHTGPERLPLPSGAQENSGKGKLRIRHAGFLTTERKVDALLQAVSSLPQRVRSDLRLEFVGRLGAHGQPAIDGLEDVVSFEDPMSPEGALAWMQGASVSLLVETDLAEGIFMPSKFADYAALGQPILALSPALGTVSDYLTDGGGLRVDPADVDMIGSALCELHRLWSEGELANLAPGPSLREQFSPQTVAGQIEEVLTAAIENAV